MKLIFCFCLAIPLILTSPAQPVRRYFPKEKDPNHKRYILIKNENGKYERVDLAAGGNKTVKVETSDVEYDLYTLSNPDAPYTIYNNDITSLSESTFDPAKLSLFVIHGWNNNRNSRLNVLIKEAVLAKLDINLFIVDWEALANDLYLVGKFSVVPVGEIVGQLINKLQETYSLEGSAFILIGHSLGAHVAGSAGATSNKKIGHIIGLDPAGPLFSLDYPEERLDTTDGELVQIIHANGLLLGFASAIGDIDYYPNGGLIQPGCGIDLIGTCSHARAYEYMAEAINRGPSVFNSTLCSDFDIFINGECASNPTSVMGALYVTTNVFGDYYLETNNEEPYGLS